MTNNIPADKNVCPTSFHPVVEAWFASRFGVPTAPQRMGWPRLAAGEDVLVAAPTGSGKTFAAFLVAIDRLFQQAVQGTLTDDTQIVYVSPLKALSNDIRRNLEIPLAEIQRAFAAAGIPVGAVTAAVRTGDTPSSKRAAMLRKPPHILVTTPESLYLLLTSPRARQTLANTRTVIVDEIHALARDKRGSHLTLTLERLEHLCESNGRPAPQRIGLSATQRPIDDIARFLVGARRLNADGTPRCSIVDVGHARELDINVEVPQAELEAVCSLETWGEIYERLCELIKSHRSTIVFVNTRRMAERLSHQLTHMLGEGSVASHHGSLSREIRLDAEEKLKAGRLKAIVATASLELGIDVGYIDLVCQIGSPRSIATFLQRVGRSGHSLGLKPKGRLFVLTRDELLESLALIRAVRNGRLDQIEIPVAPLDILAQQIVATVAGEEWSEDDLFDVMRRAWPYRNLQRSDFDAVVEFLSEGLSPATRQGSHLHRDQINGKLRARKGARIVAATSGGAIPENGEFRVVTADDHTFVGTVHEDFAIESMAGDIFLLGNTSWRMLQLRGSEMVVDDAKGAPPSIPFWLGEAPGRTIELSEEISRLREELAGHFGVAPVTDKHVTASPRRLTGREPITIDVTPPGDDDASLFDKPKEESIDNQSFELALAPIGEEHHAQDWPRVDDAMIASAAEWLERECAGIDTWPALQASRYVASAVASLGVVPTAKRLVFERFFDEMGGMQLVIHAPYGARINRAWGLAMRKCFCRSFNFELQAAATDNGVLLSLGPQHSFPIERMYTLLKPKNAKTLLEQAMLAAPMFGVRWRWNVTRALAVVRQKNGKRVPPNLQRFRADDLLAAVFPMQTACLENVVGDIEIPTHPLVRQTVHDCMTEVMDLTRWLKVLQDISTGRIELVARDTREPSTFSHELLNANPYAFLDDAPLEERRARAVATRRGLDIDSLRELARLDPEAIARVRAEAWPLVRGADELHDTLLQMGALPSDEGSPWRAWYAELEAVGRAATARLADGAEVRELWIACERWPILRTVYSDATVTPEPVVPEKLEGTHEPEDAVALLVRGRLECCGPIIAEEVARILGLRPSAVEAALLALEAKGLVLRGAFTDAARHNRHAKSANGSTAGPSTPGGSAAAGLEWCERRLLARIHRLTLETNRKQIEPVSPVDFMRFLFEHQHLTASSRWEGERGLFAAVEMLEGFESPAGAWEHDLFPSRINDYEPGWLDELTLAGEVTWGRLAPPSRSEDAPPSSSPLTRVVPISLAKRSDLPWLLPPDRKSALDYARGDARLVYDSLVAHGALFPQDLLGLTGLLPSQLDEALSELAALGLVTADAFASIRGLVGPARRTQSGRRRTSNRARRSAAVSRGGRWSRFPVLPPNANDRSEHWARLLLRRYGVVFRDLLARESVAPPWFELCRVYRRQEARGEVRGGRFVAGVAGEQFALPGSVEQLRAIRKQPATGNCLVVSAADPANLSGIVAEGPRIAASRGNAAAFIDGRLVASLQSGRLEFHADLGNEQADQVARRLQAASPDDKYAAESLMPVHGAD